MAQKPKPRQMAPAKSKKTTKITRRSLVGVKDYKGEYAAKGPSKIFADAGRSRMGSKTSAQRMQENAARTQYNRVRDARLKRGQTKAQAVAAASKYVRENFNLGGTRRGAPKYKIEGPRDVIGRPTTTVTGRRTIIRKKK